MANILVVELLHVILVSSAVLETANVCAHVQLFADHRRLQAPVVLV